MIGVSQTSGSQIGHSASDELKRAKMELLATRERGEPAALQTILAHYPQHAAALVEFSAALTATGAYAGVTPTPETERIAAQARSQAFAAVFGAPAAAPAFGTLKALRNARQLSLKAVAERLAGNREAARETLRTAIQAAPTTRWGAKIRFELSGIELASGNLAAAEELARAEAARSNVTAATV